MAIRPPQRPPRSNLWMIIGHMAAHVKGFFPVPRGDIELLSLVGAIAAVVRRFPDVNLQLLLQWQVEKLLRHGRQLRVSILWNLVAGDVEEARGSARLINGEGDALEVIFVVGEERRDVNDRKRRHRGGGEAVEGSETEEERGGIDWVWCAGVGIWCSGMGRWQGVDVNYSRICTDTLRERKRRRKR